MIFVKLFVYVFGVEQSHIYLLNGKSVIDVTVKKIFSINYIYSNNLTAQIRFNGSHLF